MKLSKMLRDIPIQGEKTFKLGVGKGKVKRSSITSLMTRLKNEEDIYLTSTKIKDDRNLIIVKRIK